MMTVTGLRADEGSELTTPDYHAVAHDLVKDLHQPSRAIFWTDLLVTASLAWATLFFAVKAEHPASIAALTVLSAAAFYRGLCFVHELAHLRKALLPGFEVVWNFLFGVPLLLPSFTYIGVHQDHHRLATFGTEKDPEYLPFAQSHIATIVFAVHSVLIPLFLALRFLVLSPIALLVPAFHHFLAVHASSLTMNLKYERAVTSGLASKMRRWEVVVLAFWIGSLALVVNSGGSVLRVLAQWYAVSAILSVVNSFRTLGAHRYESEGQELDRNEQVLDSLDTPGGIWTELWAPVGLRYHALHHYFPGIPYHNLGAAYRRLLQSLPGDASYRESTSPSLGRSLANLLQKGLAATRRRKAGTASMAGH